MTVMVGHIVEIRYVERRFYGKGLRRHEFPESCYLYDCSRCRHRGLIMRCSFKCLDFRWVVGILSSQWLQHRSFFTCRFQECQDCSTDEVELLQQKTEDRADRHLVVTTTSTTTTTTTTTTKMMMMMMMMMMMTTMMNTVPTIAFIAPQDLSIPGEADAWLVQVAWLFSGGCIVACFQHGFPWGFWVQPRPRWIQAHVFPLILFLDSCFMLFLQKSPKYRSCWPDQTLNTCVTWTRSIDWMKNSIWNHPWHRDTGLPWHFTL